MDQKKKEILIAGPTASGKSEIAIKLAQRLNGEIINADSMQIYKEISILTSKPITQDKKRAKHHLYGFVSVKKNFSTGHWLKFATKKIEELWKINKIPILVGGTGLYFKSLVDGFVKIPEIPKKVRNSTRKLHTSIKQSKFYIKLIKIDPLAKKFISPNDSQRSIRAYEVKKFTNKSLFDLTKKTKPKYDNDIFRKIFINIPKEELHKKIEKRVDKMINSGVIKEVEKFSKMKVRKDLSSNKIIGVKEIKNYLDGSITLVEAKELIAQKTRQYAKRQFTWSRGHMKSWNMIYSSNVEDLLEKMINKIS